MGRLAELCDYFDRAELNPLEDWVVDLVMDPQYKALRVALLSAPQGQWSSLRDLGYDVSEHITLEDVKEPNLFAVWLDDPYAPDPDYCILIFFQDYRYWTKVCVVNRTMMLK